MSTQISCTPSCCACGSRHAETLRQLQAIADAIPVRRYTASQIPTCGCSSGCGCCGHCHGCGHCGCGHCGCDHCVQAQYYGYPTQEVPGGGALQFSRYSPPDDGEAVERVLLPAGRFLVSYSVNASASDGAEATLGLAPWINGVAFPRGGSFATVPAGGSAALSTSFVVTLQNQSNALGFRNSGTANTTYQLLNISITRLC